MMPDELLNNIPCEVFRIFLTELEDPELAKVYEQLRSELASRRACDIDCARLFFISLTASNLEIARQQILAEQAGRLEDSKMAGLLTVAEMTSLSTDGDVEDDRRNAGEQRQISLACGKRQSDQCVDRVRRRGSKEKTTLMNTFTLSDDNKITISPRGEGITADKNSTSVRFDSQNELARITAAWPMGRLIDIYNSIGDHTKVQKFANRNKAVERIWRVLQLQAGDFNPEPSPTAEARNKPKPRKGHKQAATAQKTAKKTEPGRSQKTIKASGKGREAFGKKATVIAMLKRARGVTLTEIMAVTGWQAHTVRGLVSILGSKGGEKIESTKNTAGERMYRIAK